MDIVLERLGGYLAREEEIKSKVLAASLYPIIISILTLLVVLFIMTWVMPRFSVLFESVGVTLPAPTRLILSAGAYVRNGGMGILVGIAVIAYSLRRWGKAPMGRFVFDNVYLHIPALGKIIKKITVARFAGTLAILIRSGIPVIQALEVTGETVANAVLRQAVSQAGDRIREGQSIAAPFQEARLFEPMITHMIAVGEETGQLDEMLIHIADYYERELLHAVEYLAAVIEPVLILSVALAVGTVVVATLLPIFDMMSLVSG